VEFIKIECQATPART